MSANAARDASASVLVVDDDDGKRLAMTAMLAPMGYTVIEADSGRSALRAVLRRSFAVILMDVRMPTLDGYATARLMRERDDLRLTPIIFITAFGGDETETASAYASGAVDFIFAPVMRDVLQAKVSTFVALHLKAQELERSVASVTKLNAALRDSETRAQAVLQHVADGIVTTNDRGLIESFNGSAQRLFGYTVSEIIGQPLRTLVAASHHDIFSEPSQAMLTMLAAENTPGEPIETIGCRKDGSQFPMEMDLSQMNVGPRMSLIGCFRDISGRKAYTDALEHRALHDSLTGLPNRTLLVDRMDRSLANAGRAAEPRAVLLVDLDNFRELNSRIGRPSGDLVLRAVADRLRGAMRSADTVARLSDDEFAVLPYGLTDVETAAVAAWKIRDAFEQPFLVAGETLVIAASIGIAFYPEHGSSPSELLRRAELAVRHAKRPGSGLAVFVSEPEDQTERRLTLLSELRECIPRGELELHFQPKIDLAGGRRTVGVEALVRWRHPTDGLLMPGRFMPEAERSELIEPLTHWVLDAALHQQRIWLDEGLDLTMAVNISARSLTSGSDLPDTVARLTEAWAIPADRVILELTEGSIIDAEVPEVLDRLHAMGEHLSIDDFGTGHSSLLYLQRLPVDQIKVDRSFVINLASVPNDAVIVRSTIDLAHNLGLSVVAEGVEDAAALEMLVEYGCDAAQGYFFSRPCPADELTTWLRESPFGAATVTR